MKEKNLDSISKKIVLVRVGYDISNFDNLERITSSKNTINTLLENKNKVILLTKWGRPKGQVVSDLSTKNFLKVIKDIFPEKKVFYFDQFKYTKPEKLNEDLSLVNFDIMLFENIYFDERENSKIEAEREEIAKFYASVGEVLVDECFISSHRKDATNYDIKNFLPFSYGVEFKKEVENLSILKKNPKKPYMVLMGGAKLETKLELIKKMLLVADKVMVGGLLCFTFLKAQNNLDKNKQVDIKSSIVEESFVETAQELLSKYGDKIILPVDISFNTNDEGVESGSDIGPKTVELYKKTLENAKTVFWNGPMGWVEKTTFDLGTNSLAHFLASNPNIYKVIGGGDTLSCIDQTTKDKFNYISLGGGATLEFLAK
jgi:phosphoglycerate kinase